nr:hypothetical protein [Tanacetum cinerariifolium]
RSISRPARLGLRHRAPRRWRGLRRLRRANHLPAVSKNGRRAGRRAQCPRRARRQGLGQPAVPRRRRPGSAVPPHPHRPGQGAGYAGRHLQKGPE